MKKILKGGKHPPNDYFLKWKMKQETLDTSPSLSPQNTHTHTHIKTATILITHIGI